MCGGVFTLLCVCQCRLAGGQENGYSFCARWNQVIPNESVQLLPVACKTERLLLLARTGPGTVTGHRSIGTCAAPLRRVLRIAGARDNLTALPNERKNDSSLNGSVAERLMQIGENEAESRDAGNASNARGTASEILTPGLGGSIPPASTQGITVFPFSLTLAGQITMMRRTAHFPGGVLCFPLCLSVLLPHPCSLTAQLKCRQESLTN